MFSSGCRGTVRGDFRREFSGDREGPPARPPPAPGGGHASPSPVLLNVRILETLAWSVMQQGALCKVRERMRPSPPE